MSCSGAMPCAMPVCSAVTTAGQGASCLARIHPGIAHVSTAHPSIRQAGENQTARAVSGRQSKQKRGYYVGQPRAKACNGIVRFGTCGLAGLRVVSCTGLGTDGPSLVSDLLLHLQLPSPKRRVGFGSGSHSITTSTPPAPTYHAPRVNHSPAAVFYIPIFNILQNLSS